MRAPEQDRKYYLYQRPTTKKKKVYYAKIICPETGKLLKTFSTGESVAARAAQRVEQFYEDRQRREEEHALQLLSKTVSQIAAGFWDTDGEYARGRRARGYSVSNTHLDISEGYTRNHILPVWGTRNVQEVTAGEVDRWVLELHRKGSLAPATINKLLATLRSLLDYAVRYGHIPHNPAAAVKPLKPNHKQRGVLTDAEVQQLFSRPENFLDMRHYVLNLLSLTTGARLGEIRGLLVEDIHPTHIVIQHAWEEGYGIKEPKYGSVRAVPISGSMYAALQNLVQTTNPESLLFFSEKRKDHPISKSHIEKGLYKALVNMALPADAHAVESRPNATNEELVEVRQVRRELEATFRQRGITFHSWRHKLNSTLRSRGVPDSKIRLLTGHRSEAMTDWYTRYQAEDFAEVVQIHQPVLRLLDQTGSERPPTEVLA